MQIFNTKMTQSRQSESSRNEINEPVYSNPVVINDNIPCFIEKRARTMMYNPELIENNREGLSARDTYTIYCPKNYIILERDIITVDSVDYQVKAVINLFKTHIEIAMEKL